MIRRFALCAALAAVALWNAPAPVRAQSQDIRPLIDRMDRLQRDMDVMQRNLARGGGGGAVQPVSPPPPQQMAPGAGTQPSSGFVEQTEVRLSALEGQIRDLTGRIEETLNRVAQVQQRLEKLVGDVDFRLGELEKGKAPA